MSDLIREREKINEQAIKCEKDRSSIESQKLITMLIEYETKSSWLRKNFNEYANPNGLLPDIGVEICVAVKNCLKSFDSNKSMFFVYYRAALKNILTNRRGKESAQEFNGGMKMPDKRATEALRIIREENIPDSTSDASLTEAQQKAIDAFLVRTASLDNSGSEDEYMLSEIIPDISNATPETKLMAKEILDCIDICISSSPTKNAQLLMDLMANDIVPLIMDDDDLLEYAYNSAFNTVSPWIVEWYKQEDNKISRRRLAKKDIAKIYNVSTPYCTTLKKNVIKKIKNEMTEKGYEKGGL